MGVGQDLHHGRQHWFISDMPLFVASSCWHKHRTMVKLHGAMPLRRGESAQPAQPVSTTRTRRSNGARKPKGGGIGSVAELTRRLGRARCIGVAVPRFFPLRAARPRARSSDATPRAATPVQPRARPRFGVSASPRPARPRFGVSTSPRPTPPTLPASVGDVSESDTQHRKRHPEFRPDCPRCVYSEWRSRWEKSYGSYRHEVHGHKAVTVWLAPRLARLGGLWAVGCLFCAHWAQRQADLKTAAKTSMIAVAKRGRGPRDGNTKWARFEVRSITQVAMRGISQHAQTLMHRKATRAYFTPELAPQMSLLAPSLHIA